MVAKLLDDVVARQGESAEWAEAALAWANMAAPGKLISWLFELFRG